MSEDLNDRVRRLEDLMAIHQLFIDYGQHLDAADFDAYAELFAEDGEVMLGPYGRATGRAEIKTMMTKALAGLDGSSYHLITSPVVKLDGDRATAQVMWTVINADGDGKAKLGMLGHHKDVLVRVGDGWCFQQRRGFVDIPSRL